MLCEKVVLAKANDAEYGLGSTNWPQERTASARTSDPPMVTEMGISHMQATAVTLRFHPSVYITKICQSLMVLFSVGPIRIPFWQYQKR
jgi:hypothetical protein